MGPRGDWAGVLAELRSTRTWPGHGVYLLQNGKSPTFEVEHLVCLYCDSKVLAPGGKSLSVTIEEC